MGAPKTIALVGMNAAVYSGISLNTLNGVRSPGTGQTGFRQVATLAASSFWISGGAAASSGFRYVANGSTAVTVPIVGQTPGDPGYLDARGVVLYAGKLYGSSGDASTGWAKVFSIGGTTAPTSNTSVVAALPSFPAGLTPWTFVFETAAGVWVALQGSAMYANVGTLQKYTQVNPSLWQAANNVTLSATEPIYSICGRTELVPNAQGIPTRAFVVYAGG